MVVKLRLARTFLIRRQENLEIIRLDLTIRLDEIVTNPVEANPGAFVGSLAKSPTNDQNNLILLLLVDHSQEDGIKWRGFI